MMKIEVSGVHLQTPNPSLDFPPAGTAALFALHYASSQDAYSLLAGNASVLGVIGFGAPQPDFLPAHCAFAPAPLLPQDGAAKYEIWTASSICRPLRIGPVFGACSDDLAFGAIHLDDTPGAALEDIVEQAYLQMFDFMDAAGFAAPLRFWNYLTAITAEDRGLERYRRFNIGRQKAFSARLQQALPPAASGVGGIQGRSLIYFLAARRPARPIENPRQISAYRYPKIYGPQSPSFSRASVFSQDSMQALFISGTASIVGHQTRHAGDLLGQVAETTANLRALIGAAAPFPLISAAAPFPLISAAAPFPLIGAAAPWPQTGKWALKIYLQHPDFRETVDPAIEGMFGAAVERLYLHGEICRPGLLLEIEAFHIAAGGKAAPITLQSGAL
jgi:chorismate lyase/3-hydroxybenzoate synthase